MTSANENPYLPPSVPIGPHQQEPEDQGEAAARCESLLAVVQYLIVASAMATLVQFAVLRPAVGFVEPIPTVLSYVSGTILLIAVSILPYAVWEMSSTWKACGASLTGRLSAVSGGLAGVSLQLPVAHTWHTAGLVVIASLTPALLTISISSIATHV